MQAKELTLPLKYSNEEKCKWTNSYQKFYTSTDSFSSKFHPMPSHMFTMEAFRTSPFHVVDIHSIPGISYGPLSMARNDSRAPPGRAPSKKSMPFSRINYKFKN